MEKERFSDDPILLRLYRTYRKDEALKYLFDEISSLKFYIGELKSENAELKDTKENGKPAKKWKQDEYFAELRDRLTRMEKNKATISKDRELWRNMYLSLAARLAKEAPEFLNKEKEVHGSDSD